MAWCRQATINYLSQSWPSFMSPNGVTRPQMFNDWSPLPQAIAYCKQPKTELLWFIWRINEQVIHDGQLKSFIAQLIDIMFEDNPGLDLPSFVQSGQAKYKTTEPTQTLFSSDGLGRGNLAGCRYGGRSPPRPPSACRKPQCSLCQHATWVGAGNSPAIEQHRWQSNCQQRCSIAGDCPPRPTWHVSS